MLSLFEKVHGKLKIWSNAVTLLSTETSSGYGCGDLKPAQLDNIIHCTGHTWITANLQSHGYSFTGWYDKIHTSHLTSRFEGHSWRYSKWEFMAILLPGLRRKEVWGTIKNLDKLLWNIWMIAEQCPGCLELKKLLPAIYVRLPMHHNAILTEC